jgi:hypothetical protein
MIGGIFPPSLLMPLWFIFFFLGILLMFLVKREKVSPPLGRFLMATGFFSALFLVSVFLHNIIYAAFEYFLGPGFWERTGVGDEPFFFLIAVVVCPIGFLVGVFGSIFHLLKKE